MRHPIHAAIAAILLASGLWAPAAMAANPDQLDQLHGTGQCVRCDLTGANLAQANLAGGANVTEANLTGANLTQANLTGVNLTRANLTGANLTGANLTGVILTGAKLTGATWTDGRKCAPGSVGSCK
jgi:hypothetical protein